VPQRFGESDMKNFDLEIEEPVPGRLEGAKTTTITRVNALTRKGEALLKMFCDPEDPPAPADYGRAFVDLLPEDLKELVQKAELAGASIGRPRVR
jgi:hypothetical protein